MPSLTGMLIPGMNRGMLPTMTPSMMPTKIETETQLLRLLGNSPLQVDVDLMQTATLKGANMQYLYHY